MKTCSTCNETKEISEFQKGRNQCKVCYGQYSKQYQEDNKEKIKQYYRDNKEEIKQQKKQYREDNKEKIKQYREDNKEKIKQRQQQYQEDNKEEIKQYKNNKRKTNINFKLACNLRSRLSKAIRNGQKAGSAVKDLGCSIEFLKVHLESKFKPGMNWENWSYNGWHIDHITPLASFDLTDRKQFLKASHYSNLQPLWAEENLSKSNKI